MARVMWGLRLGVPPATFSALSVAGSGFEGCEVERLKKSVRSNGAKELIFIMGLLYVKHTVLDTPYLLSY